MTPEKENRCSKVNESPDPKVKLMKGTEFIEIKKIMNSIQKKQGEALLKVL
jgi:hypothetical protein